MRWSEAIVIWLMCLYMAAWSPAAAQAPALVHRQKYAMGTVFEIVAYDRSPERATEVLDQALQEVARLDRVMSNYQQDSELSRLNRTAYRRPQSVSPDLYRVIQTSLIYSALSKGKFDITVGPLVSYWKAVMRGERAASPEEEARLRDCVGYKNIVVSHPDKVAFRCPTVQIDLGAIGKGYAVDRAVEILRHKGISNALVNGGGSTLYGIGCPPGERAWRVSLKTAAGQPQQVLLSDDSISTSEQSAASLLGDRQSGHIFDPQTGERLKGAATVSVLAATATDSDALSTTMLLLGPDQGKPLIENSAETAAIWISPTGQMKIVSNTRAQWLLPAAQQISHSRGAAE